MSPKVRVFVAGLAAFLICPIAEAQLRSAVSPVRVSPAHVAPAVRSVANSTAPAPAPVSASNMGTSVIQVSPSGRVTRRLPASANLFAPDNQTGVPGLGFDFPHLAAITGGLGNTPPSHFGRHRRHGQGFFTPIFFAGYPYYYDDFGADQSDQQPAQSPAPQPQIIVVEQPVNAPVPQDVGSSGAPENISVSPSEAPAAARVPDASDFVLVHRDGRILFASVFSVVGEQLQFVTPEGIRRTFAMSDLDIDATQQINEARGTTIQFRN